MGTEGPIDKPPLTPPPDRPPDYSAVNEPVTASPIESTLLLRHQTVDLAEAIAGPDDTSRIQQLITAAGLQPVVNVTKVHDYRDKMADETAWKGSTATRMTSGPDNGPIDNPLGLGGGHGSFGPESVRAETINLKSDLLVVQYYDSSKQLGDNKDDRSLKYWEATNTAQLSTLTDPSHREAVKERSALLNEWGGRDMVQVALIPAGTEVHLISGPASPQVEREYLKSSDHPTGGPTAAALIERTDYLDALAPPTDSMALPEALKPDQILYAIADVLLGGGPQLLFAEFDEAWIVGRGAVGP